MTDAFEKNGLPSYGPHLFRNSLTQLAYKVCETPEEFKAWSENLGHKSPRTTFDSYGHIDESRQGAIIQSFSKPKTLEQSFSYTQIEQIDSIISQERCTMMVKVKAMVNKLITIQNAAKILGVNPETLRRWDRKGKYVAKRHPINGYRLYNEKDIKALLKKIEKGESYD